MTLLRPHRLRKNAPPPEPGTEVLAKSQYDAQVGLKERLKTMLENEQLIPRVRGDPSRCSRAMRELTLSSTPAGAYLPLTHDANDAGE